MGLQEVLRLGWDRLGAVVCALLGAVVLLLGWIGVSDALYTGQQIPYVLSGGLGGIFLISLAGILWLSADLRDEWSQLDRIEQLLARQEQDRLQREQVRPQRGAILEDDGTGHDGPRRVELLTVEDEVDTGYAPGSAALGPVDAAPRQRQKRPATARKGRSDELPTASSRL